MKEVKKETKVTLITVKPGELAIAPLGLKYGIVFKDKDGNDVKTKLIFKEGKCTLDKVADKELYETVKAKLDAQFLRDTKGDILLSPTGQLVTNPGVMQLPFMLYEDFEETIQKTPVRIKTATGEVYEVTPKELKAFVESKAKKEGVKE